MRAEKSHDTEYISSESAGSDTPPYHVDKPPIILCYPPPIAQPFPAGTFLSFSTPYHLYRVFAVLSHFFISLSYYIFLLLTTPPR
ncbi:MAG: hypothetical protein LBP19_06870, partial [Treponema sp.]|nr:hypothetical protein [Treponema sp.]